MQTCSRCQTFSPDSATHCVNCGSDLREESTVSNALKRFQANPRVKNVRLVVAHNCCPACQQVEGTYDKQDPPTLPVEGCSGANGCRCFYEPMLNDIYP